MKPRFFARRILPVMLAMVTLTALVFSGPSTNFLSLSGVAKPGAGVAQALEDPGRGDIPSGLLAHLSQSVSTAYWSQHPDQAPARVAQALNEIRQQREPSGRHVHNCTNSGNRDVYNCDDLGLPQNEESIASCPTNDNLVLGGTNDYRGLVDPQGNFTGWHFSTDGGHSITNEGLLPPVTLVRFPPSREVPSGGDPVDFIPAGCDSLYAASLVYNPFNPFGDANGVAVYKTTPAILAACPGGSDPSCWPVRRPVAEADESHFLDKEWLFVGIQNGIRYVWVTYSDFAIAQTGAEIKAVRCDENLVTCTQPIPISTIDRDVQFSDVTVAADGRAYITWVRIDGELEQTDQIFTIKYRSETAPGSAVFGPEKIVHVEERAIPFGGFIRENDFRVATYPKSDIVIFNGHPRAFVVWDACRVRLFGFLCEEAEIKLKYSDDDGTTWVGPIILSNGADNYFPTISADRDGSPRLAAAWYTNERDVGFRNQQDVVGTSIKVDTGESTGLKRLTTSSNEPEADPLLGGVFIGDYIEGVLGGFGPPFNELPANNQQDNYLTITGLR